MTATPADDSIRTFALVPTTVEERRRMVVRALMCDDYDLRHTLLTETDWIDEHLRSLAVQLDAAYSVEEIEPLAIELHAAIELMMFEIPWSLFSESFT